MVPDRGDLAAQLESLSTRVEQIERRLAALEGRGPGEPHPTNFGTPLSAVAVATSELPHGAMGETLALVGRSLVILAGAFVLRALTESGVLPQSLGAAFGIAYGVLWLFFADRAAGKGATLGATFHGLTSAVIVFPLLVEGTSQFNFLSAPASAAALLAVSLAGFVVARRGALTPLLWVVTIGAGATAVALGISSRELMLFVGVLFGIAIAAFWAGSRHGWSGPGWFVVALLDGLLALMACMSLVAPPERTAHLFSLPLLVGGLLGMVALSFAAFILRTYRTRSAVCWQEIAQGSIALVVGFGGALCVTHRAGTGALVAGVVGLVLAGAAYLTSFTFIDRIEGRRVSFIFYTTAALVLTLLATISLWHGAPLAIALSIAAFATAWIGSAWRRETLSLHATICLVAAAAAAGLGGLAFETLFGPLVPTPAAAAPEMLLVLAVAAVFCWLPIASHGRTWGSISRLPKTIVLVVLLLGLYTVVVAAAMSLAHRANGPISAPSLAVLRTALLSVSAVLLAFVGRSERLREAAWLVYPLLIVGALKLMFEDLRAGQPTALVLSFVLYGGALIVAPRLARRARPETIRA